MMPGGVGGLSEVSQVEHYGKLLMAVDWRFAQIHRTGFHGRHAPSSATRGIYSDNLGSKRNVLGYLKNGRLICSESTGGDVNGIGWILRAT
jgi:hypothetical protein